MRHIELLSIVMPCHNEQEVLPTTHTRVTGIMINLLNSGKISNYEIIYVDNGSTDNTLEILTNIFRSDCRVKVIALRRNFGYQGSISAGLFYAKGDAVVTLDADLQDPPEKIPEMIEHFKKGFDLVLGVRADRTVDSCFKRFFSENYYRLMKILGADIVYNHGDFRLMAKPLVDEFNTLEERNRFIRGIILQLDSRYALVPYKRERRVAGKSKFTISSMLSLSIDGIISFSYKPLRIASLAGLLLCFAAVIGIFAVIYIKLSGNIIPGWASTLLPILALSGFQILMLGLIGEYLGRLYVEVKKRPIFTVRKEHIHEE